MPESTDPITELLSRNGFLSQEQADTFISELTAYSFVRADEAVELLLNITYPILLKRLSEASMEFQGISGSGELRNLIFRWVRILCRLVKGGSSSLTFYHVSNESSLEDYNSVLDYVANPTPSPLAVRVGPMYLSHIHRFLPYHMELRVVEHLNKATVIRARWAKRAWIQMTYKEGVLSTEHPAAHEILHAIKTREIQKPTSRTVMI